MGAWLSRTSDLGRAGVARGLKLGVSLADDRRTITIGGRAHPSWTVFALSFGGVFLLHRSLNVPAKRCVGRLLLPQSLPVGYQ